MLRCGKAQRPKIVAGFYRWGHLPVLGGAEVTAASSGKPAIFEAVEG